jgi:predicted RecB family endonuclease
LSLYQKEIGKDYVLLTCKKAQNIAKTLDFELSSPIFYRGIKELIEKKIIAKSVDKIVFYINPAIFFNGDRARFVTEVIKKKEEIEKNQLLQELEDTSKNKDFDVNETDDSVENLDLMIARLQKKKEELERKEKFGNWQDLENAS